MKLLLMMELQTYFTKINFTENEMNFLPQKFGAIQYGNKYFCLILGFLQQINTTKLCEQLDPTTPQR